MIYIDPTEARSDTRLPKEVVEKAVAVHGLEAATGADILVSPIGGLQGRDVTVAPGKFFLHKAIDQGMLIQRKSGMDLLGSIPHLSHIFQRMQMVSENSGGMILLLYTGSFGTNLHSEVVCNGRHTEWKWNAMQGALDMWQLRGGMLHWEPDDDKAADWLLRWDTAFARLMQDRDKILHIRPMSRLEGGAIERRPWRLTLESFPQVGSVTSNRIAEYAPTLAHSLLWMSQLDGHVLSGVGKETKKKWRQWLGLRDNEVLAIDIRDEGAI